MVALPFVSSPSTLSHRSPSTIVLGSFPLPWDGSPGNSRFFSRSECAQIFQGRDWKLRERESRESSILPLFFELGKRQQKHSLTSDEGRIVKLNKRILSLPLFLTHGVTEKPNRHPVLLPNHPGQVRTEAVLFQCP